MPKYFFDVEHRDFLADRDGVVLPCVADARELALRTLLETMANNSPLWGADVHRVTCSAHDHLVLFSVELVWTASAAMPRDAMTQRFSGSASRDRH